MTNAGDGGSTPPNLALVRCVISVFGEMQFPRHRYGRLHVTYPIYFRSGSGSLLP